MEKCSTGNILFRRSVGNAFGTRSTICEMTIPIFHITVSGSILALYGAVLSTITAVVQILNHFRDRVKVALTVRRDMKSLGMGQQFANMTMVIITATNVGRRPVTITGFAASLLFGKHKDSDWYLPDVRPPLPYEITEGKYVAAFLNQANVDFDAIDHWYAWDSTGREFHLNVARWHQRRLSKWRRRRATKPEKKTLGVGS
jgi:hypothetical protein